VFLQKRCRKDIETNLGPDGWQVETLPHTKQKDGTSCGIHVIRVINKTDKNGTSIY